MSTRVDGEDSESVVEVELLDAIPFSLPLCNKVLCWEIKWYLFLLFVYLLIALIVELGLTSMKKYSVLFMVFGNFGNDFLFPCFEVAREPLVPQIGG